MQQDRWKEDIASVQRPLCGKNLGGLFWMSLYVQKLDLYRDILSIFTHLLVHQTANCIFNSHDLCNGFVGKIKVTPPPIPTPWPGCHNNNTFKKSSIDLWNDSIDKFKYSSIKGLYFDLDQSKPRQNAKVFFEVWNWSPIDKKQTKKIALTKNPKWNYRKTVNMQWLIKLGQWSQFGHPNTNSWSHTSCIDYLF